MKTYLILLSLLVGLCSTAQNISGEEPEPTVENKINAIVFSGGIIFQHQFFLDANVLIGQYSALEGKIPLIGILGWRAGLESSFDFDRQIIGPKIGYEISYFPFSIRASVVNYFQDDKSQLRVVPELGISIGGAVNLSYGYGQKIIGDKIYKLSYHRVSLTVNLQKDLWKTVF